MLTWKLCNLLGATLDGGVLNNRKPGGSVDITQHEILRASVPLELDDPARKLAYPLYTVLKVLMDDYPLFTGLVMKPRYNRKQEQVEINAVGQGGYRLQYLIIGMRADGSAIPGSVVGNPWRIEGSSVGSGIANLLNYFSPTASETSAGVIGHGILYNQGAFGPTFSRDFPPGTQGWQILQDFASVDDPIEWELGALDRSDGFLNQLGLFYPRQGSDKSGTVIFHCGWGQHTAIDMSYEPDGGLVINRDKEVGQTIEGEPQKFAQGDQPESQKAFGQYMAYNGRPDVKLGSELAQFAQGAVSTQGWPQDFFDIEIPTDDGSGYTRDAVTGSWTKLPKQFGKPPRFGPGPNHDFWIGDTIGAIEKGGIDESLTGRVYQGTITEVDSAGNTQVAIKANPTVSEVGVTVVTG